MDVGANVALYIRPAIANIVGTSARAQAAKGVLTAGPGKAVRYALSKVRKFLGR